MIQFQFENINSLWKMIDSKAAGIKELTTAQTKQEVAKAVFTLTTKRFLKDFAIEANSNPGKYHHVFEWNAVGKMNKKLFVVKRRGISNGNLNVVFSFTKSSENVPVPTALLRRGRRGKRVTRRSVFRNKAEVMEAGQPVSFTAKRWIVFLSNGDSGKKVFRPKGSRVVVRNPGGRATTGAFEKYLDKWYGGTKVLTSIRPLFKDLEREVTKSLNTKNGGPVQARQAIRKVAKLYSETRTEY